MAAPRWRLTTLLLALVLVCGVAERNFRPNNEIFAAEPYITNEYIRHVHSMYDAYRTDIGSRLVVETNALIDTKYRTWKRNVDVINSLLALPKGMNDVGR